MNTKLFLVAQLFSGQPWVERLGWTLVHFLWQGAVIAAVYAIVRRWVGQARSPQVRYVLACAALAAMVIAPIVTFSFSGATDSSSANALAATASVTSALSNATPYPLASPPVFAARIWRDDVMPWLVVTWLAGALVFWGRLMGGWVVAARVRSMLVRPAPVEWQHTVDGLRQRVLISRPVRLLVSALVQVPTIVGWLRPVVLMPLGALTGLPSELVEALLAHELAHIRRHDYLANILQGVAEALLFYHPAVWWISRHIRNERELCCDDDAVAISGDALTYVRALAELESCRPAGLTLALAANGGSLQERIARLLGIACPVPNSLSGPLVSLVVLIGAACAMPGQPPAPRAFDVAAVRRDNSASTSSDTAWSDKAGTLNFVNVTLRNCVQLAYDVKPSQLETPDWMDSARYDITAKAAGPASDSEIRVMLQTLLARRFGMSLHRETRTMSAYTLTVTKDGSKLKASEPGTRIWNDSRRGQLEAHGMAMKDFADKLAASLDRPVSDATGLSGRYEITLNWVPDDSPAANDGTGGSVFTAVQEQLGLKLEPQKASVEMLVVDHAEKVPTEN
jgi:uncharacterized protein (TIGR03435 family)